MTRLWLVGSETESAWPQALREACATWGSLVIVAPCDACAVIAHEGCGVLIVIDATTTPDVTTLISALHASCPQTRIVVGSASPTWRLTRDALHAGAVDYLRKTFDVSELRRSLQLWLTDDLEAPARGAQGRMARKGVI